MALWSLFREVDVEEIARQLAPCVWPITCHPAVAEYLEDFRGRLVGPPSTEHARQLLDFIANRKSDEEFMRGIRQALDRRELKGILRTDLMAPSGFLSQDWTTIQRLANTDEAERQTRERVKIAEWLSPLNFKATQIDHLQRREPNTGEWFLESQEFRGWRDGPPGILWCPGNPGAGKTVLAAIIIEHLQTIYKYDNTAITWIYCNYKEKAEQTISNLVGSLLKQMVQNKSPISENIKELYERHQIDKTRPPLAELGRVTASEFTTYSNAFVIVDAVDECPEDIGTQAELLQVLQYFSRTAKVLATSRDVPTIKNWFDDQNVIRIQARDEDIKKYIQGRINSTRLRHLKALESDIVDEVAKRAEGMFLLARLLMDLIVVKINAAKVRKVLNDMPKGIDEIYADALGRIREQDGERRQLGEQVLKWITFAFRPLSVEELQEALAVGQELTSINPEAIINEEILVSACAGLVSIDKGEWEESGTRRLVRLIHYTAQDYFDRMRAVHFPGAHTDIAKTCITYLSQDMFLGVQLPDYHARMDLMAHYKLLDYAGKSWGDHVQEQSDEECDEMVLQFLEDEKKFLLSGQILNQRVYPEALIFMGIHLSSLFGLEHIIKKQLLNGANPNQTDNQGQTPLAWAAARGHEKVVRMLLAQPNVYINVTDKDGQTPLLRAAENGHVTVVELLLEQRNVNVSLEDKHGWTPLMWAAVDGHENVVELLLAQPNVDINVTNKYGTTPLLIAAMNGHVKVVELLLKQPNVDTNLTDEDGQTHLMLAAQNGGVQVVEVLLAKTNVDINLMDKNGRTSLSHAAIGGSEEVIELLLAQPNVYINSTGKDGLTPLFRAAQYGHVNVVELLLKQPNVAMVLTSENWAVDHAKVVKLCNGHHNLEVNLEHCLTPLYLAAENGHEKLVEFLLDQANVAMDNSKALLSSISINVPHKKLDVSLAHTLEHENNVQCICLSVEGNYLATACNDTVQIHDTKTGANISNLVNVNTLKSNGNSEVNSLCFSTDGKYLVTGGEDTMIRVWDIAGKGIWRIFEGHRSRVLSVDFSRDGLFIVSCSEDGTACIWDMVTGNHKTLYNTDHKLIRVGSVTISPDGLLIATVSGDIICIWDTQSGRLVERLNHSNGATSVAFTPDGKGLASGGGFWDGTVKHWDLSPLLHGPSRFVPLADPYDRSKKAQSEKGCVCTATFRGNKAPVFSVAVSQDGRWVVSGSADRSIRFWDLHTGQAELVLWGHEGPVVSVHLSPTGGLLATGSEDGCAKLWSYTWGKRKAVPDEDQRRAKLRVA